MTAPWSITITPVPKSEDCLIRTSDGREFTVRGLALFADGGDGHLFSYTWNSPQVAARGCVRACVEAINQGNEFVVSFYRCLLKLFALSTGADAPKQVDAKDILRRWEAEGVYNAMTKDPKEFN